MSMLCPLGHGPRRRPIRAPAQARYNSDMALSDQERRCVELACRYLGEVAGGTWTLSPGLTLDDQNQGVPSHEAQVTNGTLTAAVEVKQIVGSTGWNKHLTASISLSRSLVPSCGGRYILYPAMGLELPVDKPFQRHLKQEIQRVAPSMQVGDSEAIRIFRDARLRVIKASTPGSIPCRHTSSGNIVRALLSSVSGTFFLDDGGQPEHVFLTEQARQDFAQAIRAACIESESSPACSANAHWHSVHWYEEWELRKLPGDGNEVVVHTPSGVEDVDEAAANAIEQMLRKAQAKFGQRWGDRHIVVLDHVWVMRSLADTPTALSAIGRLTGSNPELFRNVDRVLLARDDDVQEIWCS